MNDWNARIAGFPGTHVLQTAEWGSIKARYGWQPNYLYWRRLDDAGQISFSHWTPSGTAAADHPDDSSNFAAAALCLIRRVRLLGIPFPLSIAYLPKGPLLDWEDEGLRARILTDIPQFAKEKKALFIKIDPDLQLGTGEPGTPEAQANPVGLSVLDDLQRRGWTYSKEQIQFRNTVLIDLSPDEETLLAQMKQKTRYNIRLSGRKGVTVREGSLNDVDTLYRLYAETAVRDGFVIRDKEYYKSIWDTYIGTRQFDDPKQPAARPLIAEVDGLPVAAAVIFRFGPTAWFLYGMSSEMHREKMPNYLLQWEAIKLAKAAGCRSYDMWGAPEVFRPEDTLWGVYRFKDGFQGTISRGLGAWDLPLRPALHRFYSSTLPGILALMRRRGIARTQQAIDPV